MKPEYMIWPISVPRPSFDCIRMEALNYIGAPSAELSAYEGSLGRKVTPRGTTIVLARMLIATLARNIRDMSYPELTQAIGVRSHTTFTGRSNWAGEFMRSQAGVNMHDHVLSRLVALMWEKQAESNPYATAARKSLKGNAGGAV